ncbi:hypothetical protein EC957_004674 [Mortierella hygrophila]|uniref:Uncharacterized protein n=1 Tax=Mortierella hygrophila TaxID=979708 RepID=A0A9P6F1Z8_9FUNG|nr:hypothetical protein EC957_004674 [Mortierella hygrophila]
MTVGRNLEPLAYITPRSSQLDINAIDAFVVTSSSSSAPIFEDIEMADQDLGDPLPSILDHPFSAGQESDLKFFSIMSDSDYNGSFDLTTDLQDQECANLVKIVRQKEKEHASFAVATSLGSLETDPILSPTFAAAAAAKVENIKLPLDMGMPRFGNAKHGKGQSFQVIRDPHLFLDSFKTYCENSYGETPFLASAQRLLCMAILDEQTRQHFNDKLARHGSSSLTWEEFEVAFVDSVLTPKERFLAVARVAETGRRNNEFYRNFALRL